MKIPLGVFARLMLRFDAEQAVKDQVIADLLLSNATLRQQVLDLLAGDAETLAKAQALFDESEVAESALRGVVAGR